MGNIQQSKEKTKMKIKNIIMILGILVIISSLVYGTFTEDSSMSITAVQYSSQAWGDYNNDGNPDLVICGTNSSNGFVTKLYYLNNSVLTEDTKNDIVDVTECSLNFGDINNDGYLDLIVSGRNGTGENQMTTKVYTGNGTNFDYLQELIGLAFGSSILGDINNDGYLDLAVIGCSEGSSSSSNSLTACTKKNSSIYLNNGSHFEYSQVWSQNLAQVWKGSIAFGDYDSDGYLDLALSGTTETDHTSAVTKIYINNGTTFNEDTTNFLEGTYWGSLAWADFNDDSNLDLFITGKNNSGTRVTKIFKNDIYHTKNNTKPTSPDVMSSTYNNGVLILNWSRGSDIETNQTGLYYNLKAGSNWTNDDIISSKNAVSSNPTQGYFGNMMQSRNKTLYIQQRCVFYSVQTIDAGLQKSDFSIAYNYSSDEICDSYDNDCDLEADEGFDADGDGIIDVNETFDRDGDGYYPVNATVWNSSSNLNITYECSNYDEYDCDDNDNTSYPGASCSRSGYINSVYEWNITTLQCDCTGGTKITVTGQLGGGGSTVITPPDDTTEPIKPIIEPPKEQLAPSTESAMSEYLNIITEIVSKRYKLKREVVITGGKTQITEKIKALDMFGLKEVKLNLEIPKDIKSSAFNINQIDEFEIIKEDPIIRFNLGNIDALKEKEIQYIINKKLTKEDINNIIATLELKDPEEDINELIDETEKYLNLTQKVTINKEKNQTEFKIRLDYNESETVIGDVYIYTEIPKCLIALIKEELIESEYDFEIVNEDPLIVWHFNSLLNVEELNYNIKAIADEDCANQAKALAVAKKIVQVQFIPKKQNIFLILSIIPFILIIMGFFATFSEEIEHYNPKIQKLIVYIKHHFKNGFKTKHLKEKLLKEGYKEKNVIEALKLNAKNKFHYYAQKLEIGFEEIVIAILIILNILDFTEFLPGTADYIKKIISWSILAFLLYHVSITKLIIGIRKKWVDIGLIFAFFLLIMKNMVGFANAAFLETANQNAFVLDLYGYIIQNNQLFEIYFFIAGIILLTILSLYLSLNEKVVAPSFLNIIHFHPDQSKNIAKILNRFFITKITLLAFFIIIFNLLMEWLAIAVDALILVITLAFICLLLIKHREKFTAPRLLYKIEESSEKFYEKFINLFHYKKHIMLGLSGLLILHILTELGNFLIPYLTGIHDAIYFGNFYENHLPLFNIMPSVTKSLFALQSAGLGWQLKAFIALGYLLNIIAALYLILLPAYLWYHMFKNRKLALKQIKNIKLSEIHIFFSITSIVFLLINTSFIINPLKKVGLVGVDVQTKLLDLSNLNNDILIALGIGILALLVSLKFTNFVKKTVLTSSILFFTYYIYLFFHNTISYYLNSIKELFSTHTTITVYLIIFLVINIIFYTFGMISLFIELYLRRELWFEKHSIGWIEEKHHKFHFIHHFEAHKESIHGKSGEHLEKYIKKHLEEGEQLMGLKEHLINHGWPQEIVDNASKEVLKQKNFVEKKKKSPKFKDFLKEN
jgi:hypothetical protein